MGVELRARLPLVTLLAPLAPLGGTLAAPLACSAALEVASEAIWVDSGRAHCLSKVLATWSLFMMVAFVSESEKNAA